ncbi:aldose 1-epimerase family protein [Sphingomonas donggukensis]|uniref:Aldose 1-epimerase family protein n=1 Tax=Sphingomonas donggukensis TaxID=2949093 RepID=A0ABY4TT79_9SPHN|nr:aldose 1-epimerase family protein [Sphingomonas donggukensis]URW75615.1 aldose 1-epimerase family protein [Sphingomonas donggukensis]
MSALVTIASDSLSASINPLGAELTHLRDADGRELMTNADPAYWTGHAPLLFPIVGAVAGDRYRLDGRDYAMPKHGFARRSMFEMVEAGETSARFRLTDSDATRDVYPFAFALDVTFTIEGATLSIETLLANPGDRDLPASFGYHPAFAWPLPYGAPRADHRMVFDAPEGPIAVLDADGLIAGEKPSPLDGTVLLLTDTLFADDALIWTGVASRGLTYSADGAPGLRIDWDAPSLGVWTKPGAAFVCVEPWWGHADPTGFAGEIWDKPGVMRLAPGERREFAMSVGLTT